MPDQAVQRGVEARCWPAGGRTAQRSGGHPRVTRADRLVRGLLRHVRGTDKRLLWGRRYYLQRLPWGLSQSAVGRSRGMGCARAGARPARAGKGGVRGRTRSRERREMVNDSESERVRLVEVDYANTSDFIKSVVTTGATIRGLAVTIWLALVGFSVQQGLWELAALAGIVAAVFWLLDGYHGWLCAEALTHARAAEKVTSLYFNALSRGEDNKRALTDFRAELRTPPP